MMFKMSALGWRGEEARWDISVEPILLWVGETSIIQVGVEENLLYS